MTKPHWRYAAFFMANLEQSIEWFTRRIKAGTKEYTIYDVCNLIGVDKRHQAVVKRLMLPFRKVHSNGTKIKVDGQLKSFRVGYRFGIDPVIARLDDDHYPFGEDSIFTDAEMQRCEVYRQNLTRYRQVLVANGWNEALIATLNDEALLKQMLYSDRRGGLYLLTNPPPDSWVGKCSKKLTIQGYLIYRDVIAVNSQTQLFHIQGKPTPDEMAAKNVVMAIDRVCEMLRADARNEFMDVITRHIQRYPHQTSSDSILDINILLQNGDGPQ